MTTGDNRGRISKRRALVAALLTAPNALEAARAAGVSESTAHRWLRDPAFLAEVRQAEDRAIGAAVRRLIGLSGAAADVLGELLTDGTPAARLRAALGVFDALQKLEDRQTNERLTALERAMFGNQGEG